MMNIFKGPKTSSNGRSHNKAMLWNLFSFDTCQSVPAGSYRPSLVHVVIFPSMKRLATLNGAEDVCSSAKRFFSCGESLSALFAFMRPYGVAVEAVSIAAFFSTARGFLSGVKNLIADHAVPGIYDPGLLALQSKNAPDNIGYFCHGYSIA